MGRETYLADLYRQSVQALTQNRTEWMGLLSSVSKYYKMSFDKNVLIYVQRPDAGLLATKMGWEKQTGRYLKAGSKGIGVVDMNNPKATLAYYFDLADTRGDYEGFRRAMSAVWSLERQYQPEILDRFHKQFGTDENSIENCLDCQHFFRQIFLGYLSDIVQAFDTLRKNVCGDDYTSLHNPIVLSSVLPAYGMFHSIQILFL